MTSGRPFPSDFFVDSIICSLCLPKYHFFDTNFAELVVYKQNKTKQNQKNRRYVTRGTQKLSRVSEPNWGVYTRKSCTACQGNPTWRGETTRPPSCLASPRRVGDPRVNGSLNLSKK